MAKIQEQTLKIKISKLVRDTHPEDTELLGAEEIQSLEAVIRELTEQGVLIEIEKNS
jgi:hypothetical protein